MNYLQLCAVLRREFGQAAVYDGRYPQLGASSAEMASLVIRADGVGFAVGGVDRGEFRPIHEFATESEACDYVLEALRRNAVVVPETPSQRQASKVVTETFTADLLKRFDGGRD